MPLQNVQIPRKKNCRDSCDLLSSFGIFNNSGSDLHSLRLEPMRQVNIYVVCKEGSVFSK
jgi:hypothetical protein